ncbi:MAG TPA: NAD(P)H-dependent glycerol-3-phosphate dehydrogenase [Bacteroidota bacterium]
MRITVLGAGSWGTTLAVLLAEKGHDVALWSYSPEQAALMTATRTNPEFLPGIRIPETITICSDLPSAVRDAAMLVAAVPSQYLRAVMAGLRGQDLKDVLVVNVAKGVENGSLMTMSEMLHDVIPTIPLERITTLSGPSHAEEVSRRIPTTVVAASTDLTTARTVQQIFMLPYFRVYVSSDIRGVELGGSLKNVIAIAAGIIDGAELGDNTKAALMTRGIAEIARVGVALGAHVRTFSGLSGIGDLMVTCMSRHSRNRYVGVEIGKGRKLRAILADMVMVAEGVDTTRAACALAARAGVEVPIISEVYKILFEDKDPLKACYDLMTRDPKGEM